MKLCWHKWSSWITTGRLLEGDKPVSLWQQRTCTKCLKVQLRGRTPTGVEYPPFEQGGTVKPGLWAVAWGEIRQRANRERYGD